MDTFPPITADIPEKLRAELEQSREDLAAGRLVPAAPFLAEMRARIDRRIEAKQARGTGEEQATAKPD